MCVHASVCVCVYKYVCTGSTGAAQHDHINASGASPVGDTDVDFVDTQTHIYCRSQLRIFFSNRILHRFFFIPDPSGATLHD